MDEKKISYGRKKFCEICDIYKIWYGSFAKFPNL